MKRLMRQRVAHNIAALYAVHFANIVLPLATVPYLARVLKPEAWGLVAFAQAVAVYLTMIIGYGFNTAGTREVARNRQSPGRVAEIVAGVVGAKLSLAALCVVLSVLLQFALPAFRHRPLLFYSACAWGIFQGLGSVWYFRGVEDLRVASVVEILCKSLSAGLTFALVRGPQDAWKVVALLAAGSMLADCIEAVRMFRQVGLQLPTRSATRSAFQLSWSWFLFEAALTLYSTTGTLVVGAFAAPAVVAFYSGAERLTRTVRVSMDPVVTALFPRLAYLAKHDPEEGQRVVGRMLLPVTGCAALLGAGMFFSSRLLVRVILGPGYEAAVPILRVFSLLPPLYTLGMVLGNLWAYPLGHDRRVTQMMGLAVAAAAALALALVPSFGGPGMAWAAVLSQFLLTGSYYVILVRCGRAPSAWDWLPPVAGDRLGTPFVARPAERAA